jgi:hypothetical protein
MAYVEITSFLIVIWYGQIQSFEFAKVLHVDISCLL